MLKVSKKELFKALAVLSKVTVAKNRSNPVLGCVRLQTVNQQELKLTATNLDEYLSCTLNVTESTDNMDVLLPVSDVKKFISGDREAMLNIETLPDGCVSISEDRAGQLLTHNFNTFKSSEFPSTLFIPENMAKLDDAFMHAVNKLVPSISLIEIRKELRGILLHSAGMVATDGKQLCLVDYALPVTENCIMPVPHCLLGSEFISDSELGIAKDKDSQWITLRIRNWTWTAKAISGRYPVWRNVIPREDTLPFRMELDKKSIGGFIEKLKMLKDNPPMHVVKLTVSDGKLRAFSEASKEHPVECELAEVSGNTTEAGILVNRKLLLRALTLGHNIFSCDPAVFSPLLSTGGIGKLIIMTIRTKSENKQVTSTQNTENKAITNKKEEEKMDNEIKTETVKSNTVPNDSKPDTGFRMVPQPDAYDELLVSLDEIRTSIRTISEQTAGLFRKIRDNQASFKKRERELRNAREVLEKLKVSGF